MSAASKAIKPLEVVLYQDVLCAWCYLADVRLEALRKELGGLVRWRVRPFPLRIADAPPTQQERQEWLDELTRASLEPETEARGLSSALWLSSDAPRSSLPAMTALEAAQLQGAQARQLLARRMQRLALEQGLNVTRPDVVYELAASVGLEMNHFEAAWRSPQTRRLVLEEHRMVSSRGVREAPTLVIAGRWMVSGLREVAEYREHLLACLGKVELGRGRSGSPERQVH
ncbi:MAG: DsbA family protein [Myxococcaceae bacterium]|nr:DsbA family protein [Myxococcaceae bacterium]MCI0670929.1 DsbA family protein [Myxococcaceae bacterium]